MKGYHLLSALILAMFPLFTKGQSLDEAKRLCEQGNFPQAKPIFEAEYTNNPQNTSANLWLGAIALYEGNLSKAQKHLEFASRQKEPNAYLYLGELYAKMYRFNDAEKEFAKYEKANRRKKEALAKLSEKKDEAERLKKLTNKTENIQIIDSIVVPKSHFLSAYPVSPSAGELIPTKPDSSGQIFVQFVNEKKNKTYYSKGDKSSGQKIYTMEKMLDNFGNEKLLPEAINQQGNQAYPFVMSDGLTIYFASTAHNSIGGYDLFATRYNLKSDNYLTPSQLNMPFNSPFNDYMMVVDEEKGIGWFASDRFQPQDSVCIYTFIPSATVSLIESDDEDYLIRRARIASIRDSWKPETDYSPLLQKNVSTQEQQSENKDFEFIIDDRHTYFTLSDFKDSQARNTFAKAISFEKELHQIDQELEEQRNRFAGSDEKDMALENSILSLEKKAEELFHEVEKLKIQARNEEIKTDY